MAERVAVVGLGYVGLPIAVALAGKAGPIVGFDVSQDRVAALSRGIDHTGEVPAERLLRAPLRFTADAGDMAGCSFFVVSVPTPVDASNQPDLDMLLRACASIGSVLTPGAVVVVESTVYPGVTEDICGPALERASGLRQGVDFKLGYSPERINPGDREHTFETVTKIIAGEDTETTERMAAVYGAVVSAGLHRAPSIRVAEAAKVIENTQRDLNIALMNELAVIFDRLGLRTRDVLDAAGTKWNFLPFTPGLVGGHCIGVDPYYLTAKAEMAGYHPQIILAGRRINNDMGAFIARRLVKMLIGAGHAVGGARVGVLGLTFKEDVPDLRNSRVFDVIAELRQFGITPIVHDPLAEPQDVRRESGLMMAGLSAVTDLHAVVLAVPHRDYRAEGAALAGRLKPGGVMIDIKSALSPADMPDGVHYWSL